MATGTGITIDQLLHAGRVCNAALDEGPDASNRVILVAVRALKRAINRLAEDDDLWRLIGMSAAVKRDVSATNEAAIFELAAEVLTEQHAGLLVAAGYRFPPKPAASSLANATYNAVMALTLTAGDRVRQVENAHAALRNFVIELGEHLKTSNVSFGTQLLKGRKVCVAGALLVLLQHSEIKTGAEFDLSLGLSMEDGLTLEITVPIPRSSIPLMHAVAVVAAAEISWDALTEPGREQPQIAIADRYGDEKRDLAAEYQGIVIGSDDPPEEEVDEVEGPEEYLRGCDDLEI